MELIAQLIRRPTVTLTTNANTGTSTSTTINLYVTESSGYWTTNNWTNKQNFYPSHTNLKISSTRTLKYYARDSAGNNSVTNSVSYVIADKEIYAYPNPVSLSSKTLYISFANLPNEDSSLYIYTFQGELVWYDDIPKSGKKTWDLKNQESETLVRPGVYFAVIKTSAGYQDPSFAGGQIKFLVTP
jgi:hypothetical protein